MMFDRKREHSKASFVRQVKMRRQLLGKRKRKLPKPPKWQFPKNVQRNYYAQLMLIVNLIKEEVNKIIVPALPSLLAEMQALRPDSADIKLDDAIDRLSKLFLTVSLNINQKMPDAATLASLIGNETSKFNDDQFYKTIKKVLGVDVFVKQPWLKDELALFGKQNVELIKSIPQQSLGGMQQTVLNALRTGTRAEGIEDQIRDQYGVTQRRAKFIARDQIAKLNGQLTNLRQNELGIDSYTWRTSLDERVRGDPDGLYPKSIPSHFAREGKKFSWDDPPEGGHPGEDYQCFTGETLFNTFDCVNKVFRHFYAGHLTHIIANQGAILKSTPNHPVLTNRGWVAAQDVKVGDYIVSALDERRNIIPMDSQQSVVSFEDCFNTLNLFFGFKTSYSREGQFHGDISNGEVSVIRLDCLLSNKVDSIVIKDFCQFLFSIAFSDFDNSSLSLSGKLELALSRMFFTSDSIVSRLCKFFSLICSGLSHPVIHRLTFIAGNYASLQKPLFNDGSGNLISFCQFLNTPALTIEQKHFIHRQLFKIMRLAITQCREFSINPVSSEYLASSVRINAEHFSDFIDTQPITVKLHKVLDVVTSEFSGHVYNLECESGYYAVTSTNVNLVVHNCRCYAEGNFSSILDTPDDNDEVTDISAYQKANKDYL